MADAIPTPAEQQPKTQSTVVVQQPMSQWTALKQAGWWTTYDWIILGALIALWVTAFYWKMFGTPDISSLIALLLATISFQLLWVISLIFRCSWFVLRLHADVANLPYDSARIAVAYMSGQAVAPPPKK